MVTMNSFRNLILFTLTLITIGGASAQTAQNTPTTRVPVVFSGGHETDPRDRGRPVVLIAAALKVPPEVFRAAFSQVHPAPAGMEPDEQRVRQNKDALLGALSRYGVTNDRLDEVSNYYRYVRSRGELWPTKPAVAYALVRGGNVTSFSVTSGGAGYSSAPAVTVPNIPGATGKAQLSFSTDLDQNGALSSIVF
jgi:hypothetical protein